MHAGNELAAVTTVELLQRLAVLDRKKAPRQLQQLRAELARRGVRYREQQIPATHPPQYLVEQTGTASVDRLPPSLLHVTGTAEGSRRIFNVLLILLMLFAVMAHTKVSAAFQVPDSAYWLTLSLFAISCEGLLWHSRRHQHYLAFWLEEEPTSAVGIWLTLHCVTLLLAFLLTNPLGWLAHHLTAQPLSQQVLLLDMRRDYAADCQFRLLLQFPQSQYRHLCLPEETLYESFRPNDRLNFAGEWSWFGISGQVRLVEALPPGG